MREGLEQSKRSGKYFKFRSCHTCEKGWLPLHKTVQNFTHGVTKMNTPICVTSFLNEPLKPEFDLSIKKKDFFTPVVLFVLFSDEKCLNDHLIIKQ